MTQGTSTPATSASDTCRIIPTGAALRDAIASARRAGRTIGFVPTMGALHAGHTSLVDAARQECDLVVASIFVNPTQFGPGEDFERYPRNLTADVAQLAPRGVEIVFVPSPTEIYRPGHATIVEVAGVTEPLEGPIRPGHFRGVATVVLKLLNLVAPDVAFFGQKDFQQSLVVRRLVADLDVPVKIRVCPTVREPDGLAMSSRNAYLAPDDRQKALVLSRCLAHACELFESGQRDAAVIKHQMREMFDDAPGAMIDYLTLADSESLHDVDEVTPHTVALVAARVGSVRLIDNCFLGQKPLWQ
ncbi:MAG TPA: pantoate--beta-alanine ligase [Pirellulales bacterium]|jgi:pantoate--beta-alanine ligase